MAVQTHALTGFANKFLRCAAPQCGVPVYYWHNPDHCHSECTEGFYNHPCEHKADVISICDSWSPVDECMCANKETHDRS